MEFARDTGTVLKANTQNVIRSPSPWIPAEGSGQTEVTWERSWVCALSRELKGAGPCAESFSQAGDAISFGWSILLPVASALGESNNPTLLSPSCPILWC